MINRLTLVLLLLAPFAQSAPLSYSKHIKPILAHNCYECHANGKTKGGLSLMSRELLLKGGKNGAAFVDGKSAQSALIKRITTTDPDEVMPPEGKRLTTQEVALLSRWIDEGAKWDEVPASQLHQRPPSVLPRKAVVPPGEGTPVDRLLTAYFAKNNVPVTSVDDRTFARRLYLDLTGLPPTPSELAEFLSDPSPDKRARLAEKLLADNERYAQHWITFWQDHLRDGKLDLGSTDIFRAITPWLLKSLKENKPYDQLVRELVNPKSPDNLAALEKVPDQDDAKNVEKEVKPDENDAFGFIQGLRPGLEKPRGDQRWEVQAVQNISQVFLGTNLKCATCHDSFIDSWTMADTWGLASVYSEKPLEAIRCEMPQGVYPPPAFIFPEVGQIDPKHSVAQRREKLAELVTSPRNGRFARTVANRLWAALLGRGIVDPVDDMDYSTGFDPELLEQLANELVDNKYDLKKTILTIVTSRAYAMPVDMSQKPDGIFRGPTLRRMTAEQFVDSTNRLMGRTARVWTQNGGRVLEIMGRPDRRTVATSRENKASPMQALELLNGPDLFEMIYYEPGQYAPRSTDTAAARKKEAEKLKDNKRLADLAKLPATQLIDTVITHALSRPATDKEVALYTQVLGDKPTPQSTGDFLWIVAMLPEFQLIR